MNDPLTLHHSVRRVALFHYVVGFRSAGRRHLAITWPMCCHDGGRLGTLHLHLWPALLAPGASMLLVEIDTLQQKTKWGWRMRDFTDHTHGLMR